MPWNDKTFDRRLGGECSLDKPNYSRRACPELQSGRILRTKEGDGSWEGSMKEERSGFVRGKPCEKWRDPCGGILAGRRGISQHRAKSYLYKGLSGPRTTETKSLVVGQNCVMEERRDCGRFPEQRSVADTWCQKGELSNRYQQEKQGFREETKNGQRGSQIIGGFTGKVRGPLTARVAPARNSGGSAHTKKLQGVRESSNGKGADSTKRKGESLWRRRIQLHEAREKEARAENLSSPQ